jgi:hypothetical protein
VGSSNHREPQTHPLASFSNLQKTWDDVIANIDWQAPRGYIGSVGSKLIRYYLEAGLGLVC